MDLFREGILILWTISITLMIFYAGFTLIILKYKGSTEETDESIRLNLVTWTLFFLFTGIGNTFGVINRLYLIPLLGKGDPASVFADLTAISFDISGITAKIFYIEKYGGIFKRKFFTYYNIGVIIFGWILWDRIKTPGVFPFIFLIAEAVGFFLLPFLYLVIALKSSAAGIRKCAFYIMTGLLIIEICLTLQAHNLNIIFPGFSDNFIAIFGFPYQYTTPLEVTLGTYLIFRGYKKTI